MSELQRAQQRAEAALEQMRQALVGTGPTEPSLEERLAELHAQRAIAEARLRATYRRELEMRARTLFTRLWRRIGGGLLRKERP